MLSERGVQGVLKRGEMNTRVGGDDVAAEGGLSGDEES